MPTHAQRLIFSVRSRNLERLRHLIARHGNASARSMAGRTALHAAAEEGDLEAVRVLIHVGCDVNAQMSDGQTPLQLAAGCGRPWDLADKDVDRKNPCRRKRRWLENDALADRVLMLLRDKIPNLPRDVTPVSFLPEEHKRKVFAALSASFGNPENRRQFHDELRRQGINVRQLSTDFAEFLEGEPRFLTVARLLLEQGAYVLIADKYGNTPLSAAVEYGTIDMVELLLLARANSKTEAGIQPDSRLISRALDHGRIDKANLLLRSGISLDTTETDCLNEAAGNGRADVVKWLSDNGMPIDQPDDCGNTALMVALYNGHHEVAAWLVQHGVNTRSCNRKGDTVMHLAANWYDCLQVVIHLGLPVDQKNEVGDTPLHVASSIADIRILKAVIDAGSPVNAQNNEGETPLHRAISAYNLEPDIELPMLRALIKAGIDRSIQNLKGKTAFDLAVSIGFPPEYLHLLDPTPRVDSLGTTELR